MRLEFPDGTLSQISSISIESQQFYIDEDGCFEVPEPLVNNAILNLGMRRCVDREPTPIEEMSRGQLVAALVEHQRSELEKAEIEQLRAALTRVRGGEDEIRTDGDDFDKMKRHALYTFLRSKGIKLGPPPHSNDELRAIARKA